MSKSKSAFEKDETPTQIARRGNRKRSSAPTSSTSTVDTETLSQNEPVTNHLYDLPVEQFLESSALSEHRFLYLSEYSVQRAYVCNAMMLAIDAKLLANDEGLSPWTVMHPFQAPSESFPRSLSPTQLQLRTYHHPFLDLLASSGLRDNIILAMLDGDQEDQLCHSFHSDSLRVWGAQPWSPIGWEFSQTFVDKWGWLLDAATIDTSNFWRFERGEAPLRLTNATPAVPQVAESLHFPMG